VLSTVREILARRPTVGLAIGVVRDGWLAETHLHGLADIESCRPITSDTIFRIASITKTFTAIAIMQLWEDGRLDIDAPAVDVLRGFRLVPARPAIGQPTIRHLLTHTSGIPDVRRLADLLHVQAGPIDARPPVDSVPFGDAPPTLSDVYRSGLRIVVEPGSAFAYSNHGFAVLGQIVEDVSGVPIDRYLRERVFEPLGMADTSLARTDRIAGRLATGYLFPSRGPRPAPDREWSGVAAGGAYSSLRDLARYAAALVGGGTNEHGSVLRPQTLAQMFEPHYRTDARLPAMGLGFFRTDGDGHRWLIHDGILPGFNARLAVAPDDGVAVITLLNGSAGAMRWLPEELAAVERGLVGSGGASAPIAAPHHPEVWEKLCGRYRLPPRIGDLRGRLAMGGGVEVLVHGGRLILRLRLPVPALWRGLPLEPDDPDDPHSYRLDLGALGMGPIRLVFGQDAATGRRAIHTDLGGQPVSFLESAPSATTTALLAAGVAGSALAGTALWARSRGRG